MNKYVFVATTLFGLEDVLAKEIEEKGGENISVFKRAVSFRGGIALLYKMNYSLRTALRVLWKVKYIRLKTENDLYNGVYSIPWETYFDPSMKIAVQSVVTSPFFNNTHFVSLKVKDAIVDRFRDKKGNRPDVNVEHPDVIINVHISDINVDISLDSSGTALFKRGYRLNGYQAPLNEVLAAGMILKSGWNAESDFIDPMCGSATLSVEAAMIARNIPPGVFRKSYAFQNWLNYDKDLYEKIVEKEMISKDFQYNIYASDISEEAVQISKKNIDNALLIDIIKLEKKDFFESRPKSDHGTIIINPPYGERMSMDKIEEFYKNIGDHLKTYFKGYKVWMLSPNVEGLKAFGLRPGKKMELLNGQIKCKYLKYELFAGKRNDFVQKKRNNLM